MSPHVLTICLAALAVAAAASIVARPGVKWSSQLRIPRWTPAAGTVVAVWAAVYAMGAASALLVFSSGGGARPEMLAALFAVSALLNVVWCFLFFVQRQIGSAVLSAALLGLAIAMLIANALPVSLLSALLLAPYLAWVIFAAGLNYAIFRLNA